MINELMQTGFLLTIAGIVIMILASLVIFTRQAGRREGKVQGGGAILIGPIPIVWGTDRNWVFVAIILVLIVMFISFSLPMLGGLR